MRTYRQKFVALTAIAGLSIFGAACEAEGGDVESPGVEEPADDVIVEDEPDTTIEEGDDTTVIEPEGDTGTEPEGGTGTETEG